MLSKVYIFTERYADDQRTHGAGNARTETHLITSLPLHCTMQTNTTMIINNIIVQIPL